MVKWQEVSVSEVVEIIGGGTPKTTNKEFWDGDIPWLSIEDFNNDNRFVSKTVKTITDKGLEQSSTKLLNKGDLIISARGTVGKLAQLDKQMAFNQSCYGLRGKPKQISNGYLYYALKTAIISLQKAGHGAVFNTITRDTFEIVSIPVPPLDKQEEIENILGSIDQKIELNQRMNETLEGMARSIFKSWFVDFDPVHAKAEGHSPTGMDKATAALFPDTFNDDGLPDGWTQESVISSAEYINGAAYKNMHFSEEPDANPVIKIAELKNGISPQTKFTNTDLGDKYKLDTGDILFSWSGSPDTSIDTFIWTGGAGWLNQHIFKVVNKTRAERCFTFWLLKYLKPEFIEVARNKQTTGLGHVTRKDMDWMQYFKPDPLILNLFYETVGLLLDQIENNLIQNQNLAALRDTLLPKLISGDLRVNDTIPLLKEAVR